MQLQQILLSIVASISIAGLGGAAHTQQIKVTAEQFQVQNAAPVTQPQEKLSDVPYVPTPSKVVEEMLNVAGVTGNDFLYDLGSGDGRIVITAAQKFGTQGVGIDINPKLIQEAFNNAQKAGVTDRVQFLQQDLFKADLSKATVVTLYLLRSVNLKLRPKLLKELKPGTRIVSHSFDMGDWKPDRVVIVDNGDRKHVLFYWVVPETIPDHLK
ncbi:methyltransferase domain-containing protein [Microcoleus sp. FACHB-68]|uniref:class I SAM-dependent methyltransferase n=1 Tax=Microcoleus sp. FACHB-68 TaxID=2692826 RepID=UPI001686A6F7|nr:methyltransferase domain-containing protein [Microcoleus sp. FACHB-68]MBD1940324.1 class I SAM-dependent methyltransferase [Microcoleus sp. FACHB-68]